MYLTLSEENNRTWRGFAKKKKRVERKSNYSG